MRERDEERGRERERENERERERERERMPTSICLLSFLPLPSLIAVPWEGKTHTLSHIE